MLYCKTKSTYFLQNRPLCHELYCLGICISYRAYVCGYWLSSDLYFNYAKLQQLKKTTHSFMTLPLFQTTGNENFYQLPNPPSPLLLPHSNCLNPPPASSLFPRSRLRTLRRQDSCRLCRASVVMIGRFFFYRDK